MYFDSDIQVRLSTGSRKNAIAVMCLVISTVGCHQTQRQTMSQYLPSVPQMRWPGSRETSHPAPVAAPPTVSANVAAISPSTDNSSVGEFGDISNSITQIDSVNNAPDRLLADMRQDSIARSFDQRLEDTVDSASTSRVAKPIAGDASSLTTESPTRDPFLATPSSTQNIFAENSTTNDGNNDQIARLKAALNEDARRASDSQSNANVLSDVRARVEALQERARRMFARGELTEARHSARMAQDLGETAKLDFSPDEERPSDLVLRIDDELRQTADIEVHQDSNSSTDLSSSQFNGQCEGDEALPKTSAEESHSDLSQLPGNSKLKNDRDSRNWMRNYGVSSLIPHRKSGNKSSETSSRMIAPPSEDQVQPDLSFETSPNTVRRVSGVSELGNATVQANRSMSLSRPGNSVSAASRSQSGVLSPEVRTTQDEDIPISQDEPQALNLTTSRERRVAESGFETDAPFQNAEPPALKSRSTKRSSPISFTDSFPARIETDDAPQLSAADLAPAPPEFDDVRPLPSTRNVLTKTRAPRPALSTPKEVQRTYIPWVIGATLFVISSIAAIVCYRRGAT